MNIMFAHKVNYHEGRPIETYSRSFVRTLENLGHKVIEVEKAPFEDRNEYKKADILIDMDCGRDETGSLRWHGEDYPIKRDIPCAVILIDSHGYPDMHRRIADRYNHVFFAVWDKRDLFANMDSTHWCPNFTDMDWFNPYDYPSSDLAMYDFGFFGSKKGLNRADQLIEICNEEGWTHDVRQVNRHTKHRWPATPQAMSNCKFLFNHGQKHDGPNLRVMESMAMERPLITDSDKRSGMNKLFTPWKHYIPYMPYTYEGLEEAMKWCMNHPKDAANIARTACREVGLNHTVDARVDQVLGVFK